MRTSVALGAALAVLGCAGLALLVRARERGSGAWRPFRGRAAGKGARRWQLTLLSGPTAGAGFPVEKETTIGRASECDIPVDDEFGSRFHARLEPFGDEWILSDLASRNGTWVNRARVKDAVVLYPGDAITVGTTSFRFEVVEGGARSASPSPSTATYPPLQTLPASGIRAPDLCRACGIPVASGAGTCPVCGGRSG